MGAAGMIGSSLNFIADFLVSMALLSRPSVEDEEDQIPRESVRV